MMEPVTVKVLIASLLAWINVYTGYDIPKERPYVTPVPHTVLEQMACSGPCPILGLYPDDGVIYLDEGLKPQTNICARSILLHELVHYVQEASGRFASQKAYVRWKLREIEAHHIQDMFLAQNGRRVFRGRPIALRAFMGPTC